MSNEDKKWYLLELPVSHRELYEIDPYDFIRNLVNFNEIDFDETYLGRGFHNSREFAYSYSGEDYYWVAFRCSLDEKGVKAVENCQRDFSLCLEFSDSDEMEYFDD